MKNTTDEPKPGYSGAAVMSKTADIHIVEKQDCTVAVPVSKKAKKYFDGWFDLKDGEYQFPKGACDAEVKSGKWLDEFTVKPLK